LSLMADKVPKVSEQVEESRSGLRRYLRPSERVLWSSKPVKMAFLFSGSTGGFAGMVFALGFSIFWLLIVTLAGAPWFFAGFGVFFLLLIVFGVAGSPLWQLMRYRNTEYMITDQRIITQTGVIGLDTRFVNLDRIQEVYIKVGFIDKIFGTGSVIAVTAGFVPVGTMAQGGPLIVRPSLDALREPYEVQRLLQEAIERTRPGKL